MISIRTSSTALTDEFALQTRCVCTAVELLRQASVSITLETARSQNLVSTSFYLFLKLVLYTMHEMGRKFRVLANSKFGLYKLILLRRHFTISTPSPLPAETVDINGISIPARFSPCIFRDV